MLKTTGSSDLAPRKLEIDEVVGGSGRTEETVVDSSKLSKSRRIVKKSEKPHRPKKLQRSSVWKNVYRNTNPPSIWYKELELPLLEFWQFSKLFLLGSGALLISASIISKTKLIEPLILCHIFFQMSQDEEEDVLVRDQFDHGEDIKGVVHHQGLFYILRSPKLSWLATLASRNRMTRY